MKTLKIIAISVAVVVAVWLILNKPPEHKQSIAIITTLSHPALDSARRGFIDAIKEQGLAIKDYNAEGNVQQAHLIAEQVAHDPNVVGIFAIGTLAAQSIARVEKTKPIVIAAVFDTTTIAQTLPENLCGLTDALDATYQINTIIKLLPAIKRISLLYSPHEANSASMVSHLNQAAKKAGLGVELVGVHESQAIMSASALACQKGDAVVIPLDNQLVASMPAVIKATKSMPCAIITSNESPIHQGASVAFGVDYQQSGHDAGILMDEIVRAVRTPKAIGIIDPKTVSLYVNQRVIKEKGLILNQAAGLELINIEDSHE